MIQTVKLQFNLDYISLCNGSLHVVLLGDLPSAKCPESYAARRALTDDIRLPFELGEKRKLRAARGSGITATRRAVGQATSGKLPGCKDLACIPRFCC